MGSLGSTKSGHTLGISGEMVRYYWRRGDLPGEKLGDGKGILMFDEEEVRRFGIEKGLITEGVEIDAS